MQSSSRVSDSLGDMAVMSFFFLAMACLVGEKVEENGMEKMVQFIKPPS